MTGDGGATWGMGINV